MLSVVGDAVGGVAGAALANANSVSPTVEVFYVIASRLWLPRVLRARFGGEVCPPALEMSATTRMTVTRGSDGRVVDVILSDVAAGALPAGGDPPPVVEEWAALRRRWTAHSGMTPPPSSPSSVPPFVCAIVIDLNDARQFDGCLALARAIVAGHTAIARGGGGDGGDPSLAGGPQLSVCVLGVTTVSAMEAGLMEVAPLELNKLAAVLRESVQDVSVGSIEYDSP